MSDTIAQSPEAVAFELLTAIARVEGNTHGNIINGGDRRYILSTYVECLLAVKRGIVPAKEEKSE